LAKVIVDPLKKGSETELPSGEGFDAELFVGAAEGFDHFRRTVR
jgi:hypothetical protein